MTEVDKIERYGPVVARCRSARDPDTTYEVRKHPSAGSYSCNCKSWATSAAAAKGCKHTRAAEATEGRSGIVEMGGGRQVVLRQAPQAAGMLQGALDRMRGEIGTAVQQEAEKILAQAKRPLLIMRTEGGRDVQTRIARVAAKLRKGRPDPIKTEALAVAKQIQTITGYYTSGSDLTAPIEAAIRKFAGTQAQPAPAWIALQAERGVREIILED